VIPLDASLVKGSHGRIGTNKEFFPVLLGDGLKQTEYKATEVYDVIWRALTG
jgi:hypothetical protein